MKASQQDNYIKECPPVNLAQHGKALLSRSSFARKQRSRNHREVPQQLEVKGLLLEKTLDKPELKRWDSADYYTVSEALGKGV